MQLTKSILHFNLKRTIVLCGSALRAALLAMAISSANAGPIVSWSSYADMPQGLKDAGWGVTAVDMLSNGVNYYTAGLYLGAVDMATGDYATSTTRQSYIGVNASDEATDSAWPNIEGSYLSLIGITSSTTKTSTHDGLWDSAYYGGGGTKYFNNITYSIAVSPASAYPAPSSARWNIIATKVIQTDDYRAPPVGVHTYLGYFMLVRNVATGELGLGLSYASHFNGDFAVMIFRDFDLSIAQSTVGISPANQSITVGQSVTFTAAGGSNGYTWGGLASGSGTTKSVTFPTPGTYTVTVLSPSGNGYAASNTASSTITVTPANPPALSLSIQAQSLIFPSDVVVLNAAASVTTGTVAYYDWRIVTPSSSSAYQRKTGPANPLSGSHNFTVTEIGAHQFQVTATTTDGGTASASAPFSVVQGVFSITVTAQAVPATSKSFWFSPSQTATTSVQVQKAR